MYVDEEEDEHLEVNCAETSSNSKAVEVAAGETYAMEVIHEPLNEDDYYYYWDKCVESDEDDFSWREIEGANSRVYTLTVDGEEDYGTYSCNIVNAKTGSTTFVFYYILRPEGQEPISSQTHVHSMDEGVVTKQATATEQGEKTYKCTICGEVMKVEAIPATGAANNLPDVVPAEGTDNNLPDATLPQESEVVSDKTGDYQVSVSAEGIVTAKYVKNTNKKAKKVTIPATIKTAAGTVCKVTTVGENAFKNNTKLQKVVISSNVTTIEKNAFSGCKNLTDVTIGKNVTSIGANAFKNCKKLEKITLPAKVQNVGSNVFSGCSKLKTLTIKSKLLTNQSVDKKAFNGIKSGTTIKVPKKKLKDYKKLFKKKGLNSKVSVKDIK